MQTGQIVKWGVILGIGAFAVWALFLGEEE